MIAGTASIIGSYFLLQPYVSRMHETPAICKIIDDHYECMNKSSQTRCRVRLTLQVQNAKVTTVSQDICEGKCEKVRNFYDWWNLNFLN